MVVAGNAVFSEPSCDAALTVRRWSIAEWLASESAWSELLARSSGDALFLSWEWLTLWWQCFAGVLAAVPEILAFYRGGALVGVAPFYRRRVTRGGLLPATSVQLMGMSWRDPGYRISISEYLDIVATPAETDTVRRACARVLLGERRWTMCLLGASSISTSTCVMSILWSAIKPISAVDSTPICAVSGSRPAAVSGTCAAASRGRAR
jgi:hypothetical protein